MVISVKYFASLRENVGRSQDEVQPRDGLTVQAVWETLHPGIPLPPSILTAVNREYRELDTPVGDGDEVAFFPPVTGG